MHGRNINFKINVMSKKIDFSKVTVPVSFNGSKRTFNVSHVLGNAMRYTGSVVGDIGFDKLAETIYFSEGEVEIANEYIRPLMQVVNDMPIMATIKRELIKRLNDNGE